MERLVPSSNNNIYQFDETRYQTIGRGFTELSGVQFKIADKYQPFQEQTNFIARFANMYISDSRAVGEASAYTFDLERWVLENMRVDTASTTR